MQTGNAAAGVKGEVNFGKDGKGVGQVKLSGDVKGALGAGGSVGGTVTLKNPYSKEFRSKSFDSIKKGITSGDPK